MPHKFQFFTMPNSNRKQFTYLNMASSTFLVEKEALLDIGYKIEDDVIYAKTAQEAVEKYKSNFIHVAEEYNASTNPFYTLVMIHKWLFGLWTKKK